MINGAADLLLALALVGALSAGGGYLAGCCAYYLAHQRAGGRALSANARFNLAAAACSLVYFSFGVLLPFLLLGAHWAWWRLTARRLRHEKISHAVRTIARLRAAAQQPLAGGSVG